MSDGQSIYQSEKVERVMLSFFQQGEGINRRIIRRECWMSNFFDASMQHSAAMTAKDFVLVT
jgi:hypothetical protein